MRIELKGSTNNLAKIDEIIEDDSKRGKILKGLERFSQTCAKTCYEQGNFDELQNEPLNKKFIQGLLDRGHHSVFEHMYFTFNMIGLPKALAMVLNNEKQYTTSEKSARYTVMEDIEPIQREKYDKWMSILTPRIEKVYPDIKGRERAIRKLAQENARYMTSVFTPTKMIHTINWRQLNFLIQCFSEFEQGRQYCGKEFAERLIPWTKEFSKQLSGLKIEGMENQTDRHLSLFLGRKVEEHFGDVYSTSYSISFAGLAQEHRHRTINYHISGGTLQKKELGQHYGFFVPKIISEKYSLLKKWTNDLAEIAENDFPQAQFLKVNERGIIEDFRSKALLRMCGHAQYEIMKQTLSIAEAYKQYQQENTNALKPKCLQGITCPEPCVWGGKKALERIV